MRKPYNTEVLYNGAQLFIEVETEKAYKMFCDNLYFGKQHPHQPYIEFWCPKSVWNNEDNFVQEDIAGKLTGNIIFKMPTWLKTI